MRKKGLLLAITLLLLFAGCDTTSQSDEWALPTLAPEVVEQGNEPSEESVEKEDSQEEEEGKIQGAEFESDGTETDEKEEDKSPSGILSYLDKSKQAKDENVADTLEFTIEVACIEAQMDGMVFPRTPIRFRYTHELDQLDDSYAVLKEVIREIRGRDKVLELSVEGNYMMVEISADGSGNPKVNVDLLHE